MQKTAHTRNVNPLFIAVWVVISNLTLDRVTKWILMTQPAQSGLSLIPNVLGTTQHQNYGVLANIPVPLPIVIVLTIVALFFLGKLLRRSIEQKNTLAVMGVSSIIAGALGNLWDRTMFGYVFDWILLFDRSVINLADFFIVEGAVVFFISQYVKKEVPTSLDAPVETP
jgi:signal peptidase II